MKYLKYFEEASAYEAYKNGSDFITPNVSYVVDADEVKYTGGDFIIMTSESNPKVMEVCYNQGWAASPYEMYASEAARVTSIGTAFENLGQGSSSGYGGYGYSGYGSSNPSFTFTFDEFKYFTGVTTLEYRAFSGAKIVSIILPDSIKTIESQAFSSCYELQTITISKNVTTVNSQAFDNCVGLQLINCYSFYAPEIDSYNFSGVPSNGTLRIPTGAVGEYSSWIELLPDTWTVDLIYE